MFEIKSQKIVQLKNIQKQTWCNI